MSKDFSKIDPELHQVAKNSPTLNLNNTTVWLLNLMMVLLPVPKSPQDIHVENIVFRGEKDQANIRLRIYKPKTIASPIPVLIWLHGGGYVIGKPEIDEAKCIDFVHELGIAIVSVDYRRAPKHPFPAGLDDAYAATMWVKSHAQQLGVDMDRLAIGGESAGAGLAAALVQQVHDRQEIKPVFQLLVYPMLDDRTVLQTGIDDSNNVNWTKKNNKFGWEAYLGRKCGAEDVPVYSVPARRKDLSGLPPAWIGVGSLDIFHDEDVAYAHKLQECGVACELIVVPGAFHGFDIFSPALPIVRAFRESQISALKKYLLL